MQTRAASSPSHSTTAMKSMSSRKNLAIVTRVPKFLRCLYDILHTEDRSILSWSHDGSYFQIFSTKRLEDAVLPKYFKHSKFASFQRQLNNFGFRKWTKTQSSVCTFSHHLFVQRHPSDLVELIIEQNEQTSSSGETTDEDAAPSPKKLVSNKRKRNESVDTTTTDAFSYNKMLKTTTTSTTSFQDLLNFQVESWELMPIINPLEWQEPQQHTAAIRTNTSAIATAIKTEQGNETPTSASAVNEHTFNFTMEELDDILFTTSEPAPCSALTETFDGRFEVIDASVGFATAPSYLDQHDTTAMYLNDMFKSDVSFWLPC